MSIIHRLVALTLLVITLALIVGGKVSLAEIRGPKPARVKKVFTNEDLQKYREKYGSESTVTVETRSNSSMADNLNSGPELRENSDSDKQGLDRSYWASKLSEAENDLNKAKTNELRFIDGLTEFQKSYAEAQTDFHKRLAQDQISDSQTNLARAREQRKKAEEAVGKVLEDASKNGFKPEDLKEADSAAAGKPDRGTNQNKKPAQ